MRVKGSVFSISAKGGVQPCGDPNMIDHNPY